MDGLGSLLAHSVAEWLELLFMTVCFGVVACRLWVVGGPGAEPAAASLTGGRLWQVLIGCAAAMAVAGGADLLVRAGDMSGLPLAATVNLLPAVIRRTHLGQAWLIRLVATLGLLLAALLGRRHHGSPFLWYLLFCLLLLVALTKSASGHAADAGDFTIPETADWLHLVAAAIWGGGLLVLGTVVLPMLPLLPQVMPAAASVARRYSLIARLAVTAVAATACYNGYSFVGSPAALVGSPYGLIVAVKIGLFLLAVCLGACNRYLLVPSLQEVSPGRPAQPASLLRRIDGKDAAGGCPRSALRWLTRSIKVEALAAVLLLLCAALLRHEVPAGRHSALSTGPPHTQHRAR